MFILVRLHGKVRPAGDFASKAIAKLRKRVLESRVQNILLCTPLHLLTTKVKFSYYLRLRNEIQLFPANICTLKLSSNMYMKTTDDMILILFLYCNR